MAQERNGPQGVDSMNIVPHYSSLPQSDMDTLAALVQRVGFGPVVEALGDILIQSPQSKVAGHPSLSFCLGGAMAAARAVDWECPPASVRQDSMLENP